MRSHRNAPHLFIRTHKKLPDTHISPVVAVRRLKRIPLFDRADLPRVRKNTMRCSSAPLRPAASAVDAVAASAAVAPFLSSVSTSDAYRTVVTRGDIMYISDTVDRVRMRLD